MCGDRVVEIGRNRPSNNAEDLGDVMILPGLINAHTHLEFSDCATPIGIAATGTSSIGTAGVALHDWIGQVVQTRQSTTPESKLAAIAGGLRESADAGVRLIGEIATPPCEYPVDVGLELVTFAEVLGLSPERAAERIQCAIDHNQRYDNGAWSPHAPYSTSISSIEACAEQARRGKRMLAMHVAESPEERELLETGTGPFAESLRALGVWNDQRFPWGPKPILKLIRQLSVAPRCLIVHGNDLRADEIEELSRHPQMTVVYCPRTHAFFQHSRHPVGELRDAGIRIALGTDSRASNPDLSVWSEVQHLIRHRQDLEPSGVIAMATLHGADAFGRSDLGRLEVGCEPGLMMVHSAASDVPRLYEDLASESSPERVRLEAAP